MVAVPLLVVAREVFDRGHHALRLHAPDVLHGDLSREAGIFAEIFEIPAAEGRAVDVHAGAEQDVDPARPASRPSPTPML